MSSQDQNPAEEKPIEKMTVVELRETAKKTVSNKMTVKEKIKNLKQLKKEARKSKDKKKINFLRRRLSRFKKRSRKAA